jgi:hypothetical protein
VRLEAVRTCSRLLRLALQGATSRHSDTVTSTVADVLGKLLVVGITDTGENVSFFHTLSAVLSSCSPLIEYLIHIFSRQNVYTTMHPALRKECIVIWAFIFTCAQL